MPLLEEALADAVEGAADGFPTPYVAKSLLRIANRPSLSLCTMYNTVPVPFERLTMRFRGFEIADSSVTTVI